METGAMRMQPRDLTKEIFSEEGKSSFRYPCKVRMTRFTCELHRECRAQLQGYRVRPHNVQESGNGAGVQVVLMPLNHLFNGKKDQCTEWMPM